MNLVLELCRAEWLKFRTTRTSWALTGGLVLIVAALTVLNVEVIDEKKLGGSEGVRSILTIGGSIGAFFTICVGIIGMAGEERHGLIGTSLAAAPQRWQLVAAKLITYLLIGAVLGLIAAAVCTALAAPLASARGESLSLGSSLAHKIWIGSILSCALFAGIGVGLAALLREQVLAIIVGLAWMLLIDSIVGGVAPKVAKFFPGGGLKSVLRSATSDVLPMGTGALLLVGYVALFCAAGAVLLSRRNVT